MAECVNNINVNILIISLLHLQFWGCSYFQTATYPTPILIEGNDQVHIRYEFAEKRIIGKVDAGDNRPEAYIFAVFHRGDLSAPIRQKMFFLQDTMELLIAENHLNAAPDGNLAVLKVIGGDFQQEEIAFSYSGEDIINLLPFQLHKVPYHYVNQTIQRAEGFTFSDHVDSVEIMFARMIEGQPVGKYPKRGDERNISVPSDSISIDLVMGPGTVKTSITSTPNIVEVIIDGRPQGETPIKSLDLTAGRHTFKLLAENFAPIEKVLDIQPSRKAKLEFRLNRLNTIRFKSKESGLKYVLNDDHEWWDKRIKLQVESGKHILKVYNKDELVEEQNWNIIWNERLSFTLPDTIATVKDST